MNKVININFQGRILPIEEQAYEILKQYIASLQTYFANEEGRDEIINDIECRVAELCDDKLKKGDVCINEITINLIIESIGRPADFEAQDGFEQSTTTSSNANTGGPNFQQQNTTGDFAQKRLYRDEQNKVLGGVCSGIANYFNIDPLIVRILWIFLLGVNVLGYLILWIAVPSSSVKEVGGVRKRLFRDIDHKIIGGVCAGLSKYFGVRVGIIRLLFMIPFIRFIINFKHVHLWQFWDSPDFPSFLDFTFSPGAIFVYIVLWLVLPEARTSADKLEMVGEKVDLNSIKNTIQNDMEGFSKRAQSWGSEFYKRRNDRQYARSEGPAYNTGENQSESDARPSFAGSENKGCFHFVGRLITISVKVFVYFVLGIIGISLLAALFGMGAAGTSLLPLKGFLLEDGLQTAAAIGTILFFVWVPVIGIVTAIIRKIAGYKKSNPWVRYSFISLWVFGWICIFYFGSSLGNSFSKHNVPVEETVQLTNAKVDFLQLTAAPKMKYYEDKWFQITPFSNFSDEDTVFVRNMRVRIVQSKTDSFEIKIVKLSNGKTVQEANAYARNINFNLTQADSILYLDRGIGISKANKFRNQHIIMTIAVPVGKRILISNKGWSQTNVRINHRGMQSETFNGFSDGGDWFDEWNEPWDNESYGYEQGVEYRMTSTGLEKLKRADGEVEDDDSDSPDEIEQKLNKLKEERLELEKSLEKTKEKPADLPKDKKVVAATAEKMNKVQSAASKFVDIQWVLDRFSY
jgi:phage shock protein PspC (stress-responsive transcriptional regulator)